MIKTLAAVVAIYWTNGITTGAYKGEVISENDTYYLVTPCSVFTGRREEYPVFVPKNDRVIPTNEGCKE